MTFVQIYYTVSKKHDQHYTPNNACDILPELTYANTFNFPQI